MKAQDHNRRSRAKVSDHDRWAKVVHGTCLVALILLIGISTLAENAAVPLLSNGGFEDGSKDWGYLQPGQSIVNEKPHEGKACLRFQSLSSEWSGFVSHKFVTVPTNTTMTASSWIRPEGPGVDVIIFRRDAFGKYIDEVAVFNTKGNHDWVYFEKSFNTENAAFLEFSFRLYGEGVAFFDGLALAPGSSKAGNYLRNSGFSICATPGYPSYWGVRGDYPFSVPDWETGRYYGVDPEAASPVPGAKVLRTRWDGGVNRRIDSYWFLPPLPKGQYTASVYLKAEGDLSVSIAIISGPQQEVKPGPEWKRFQFTFTANTNTYKPCMAFPIKGTGVLWIAALQLEDGAVATPWQPSLFDVARLAVKPSPQTLPPQFPCPITSTPPQIDGKLDDPCWATAFKAKGFVDNATGNPVEPQTEALVTRDDSNLYVAFKCDEPLKGKPDWKACADTTNMFNVFKSDAVEFFLAPSAFGEDYYHVALHPGGGVYTANDFRPGWRSGVKTAAIPCEKGWTAELALPLSSLNIKSGDSWRLNFCRTRVVDGKVTDSAWAGQNSFHAPNRFARMTGIKSSISKNLAWTFLSPRLRKEPDGTFTFSCRLDNRGNVGKKLEAELNATLPLTNSLKCDFQMTRQRENLVSGGIPANLDQDAKLVLSLRNQGQSDILTKFTSQKVLYMLNPQADDSSPLSAFAEYSWYPSDVKEARVRVEWRLDEPANVHLVLGNADQPAFVGNLQFEGPEKQTIRIPLDGVAVGGSLPLNVTAEVDGAKLAATRDVIERRIRTPNSVGLNRFLRCFVVDGKPYFPITFMPSSSDLVKDWQFERLAAHGFNCLVQSTPPTIKENPVEAMRAMLGRCVKHGFKVIYWIDGKIFGKYQSMGEKCAALADIVKTFRDHPTGLAWYIMDEPGPTTWEVAYKESDIKRLYAATKATDPSRPVIINYAFGNKIISGHGCILYGGNDSHDVSMCDRYPWFPDERFEPLAFYADTAKNFNAALAPLGRVTPFWLQTFGGRDAFQEPTPDGWQNTVYVSLIYGTRALAYFAGQPSSVPLWKRMGEVHAQIRELEPVLFNPDVETLNGICENKVHYAIWSTPDAVHVMAANVAEYPAKLSLDLGQLTGRELGNGKVLFEKETRHFKAGQILETLAPGQSKAYRFALKKS
jgi:hypothetical protein